MSSDLATRNSQLQTMLPIQSTSSNQIDLFDSAIRANKPSNQSAASFQQILESVSKSDAESKAAKTADPLQATLEETQTLRNVAPTADPLRDAFHDFVGQTFFGQLIASMRSTEKPSAYFNGGRAEEVFRGQLDQVLSETLSKASSKEIADPMYKLFTAQRTQS